MQDRPDHKPASARAPYQDAHPLKFISAEQFAALGTGSVVFKRHIAGDALKRLLPDAAVDPDEGPFILVLSADGKPMLVTDSMDSLEAWLEDQPVSLASVH